MSEKTSLIDRVIKNWRTTMAMVIPAVVAIGVWFGADIDPGALGAALAGLYGLILLFSRD